MKIYVLTLLVALCVLMPARGALCQSPGHPPDASSQQDHRNSRTNGDQHRQNSRDNDRRRVIIKGKGGRVTDVERGPGREAPGGRRQ